MSVINLIATLLNEQDQPKGIPPVILARINDGDAIKCGLTQSYQAYFNGRIPLKVRMNITVESELPFPLCLDVWPCVFNREYYVTVNSYGAVTAIHEDGTTLGLKPGEFQIIEWHEK